jgi:hypothetical protein
MRIPERSLKLTLAHRLGNGANWNASALTDSPPVKTLTAGFNKNTPP